MNYKNYNYISSEVLVAEIKEELKSYFDAGAINTIMIPTYVNQALRKLKFIPLKPENTVLFFENFVSRLPEDFISLEYALTYDTSTNISTSIQTTEGFFSSSIECSGHCDDACFSNCNPKYEIFEKITLPMQATKTRIHLIRPRWVRVYYGSAPFCNSDCPNLTALSDDVITIGENGKVSATFEKGCVYMRYQSKPVDENFVPLIPEQIEIEEYIKAHIKYKFFEQLMNSVVDETFNQVKYKFEFYKQDSLNKLQAAWSLLQPTKQQQKDNVVRQRGRYKKYYIGK